MGVRTDATAGGRALDPEARLQHARELAWRALNRRDRTEVELRRILADKRAEPDAIDRVIAELLDGGYLDDARYAQQFADDRRRLDAWGSERIERRLLMLGVDRSTSRPRSVSDRRGRSSRRRWRCFSGAAAPSRRHPAT
jgi:SOS response regulatory protein OraA/RecX